MKLAFCVACGAPDDLQQHHLITRLEKGSDDETNLITLCHGCHTKLHERRTSGAYKHRQSTIAGLAAAKARGVKLGNPFGAPHWQGERAWRKTAQASAVKAKNEQAAKRALDLAPILKELKAEGIISANAQATALNERHVPAHRGGKWTARSVINAQKRIKDFRPGIVQT